MQLDTTSKKVTRGDTLRPVPMTSKKCFAFIKMNSTKYKEVSMSHVLNTTKDFCCQLRFLYGFVLASVLIGCSPSLNQPISQSLPRAHSTTADGTHNAFRSARPIPVVVKPAVPFRVSRLSNYKAFEENNIVAVSAEIPAVLPHQASLRNLKQIHNAATASTSSDIQNTFATYLDAFNRHDAIAMASHWVTDGENLDLDTGNRTVGRTAVERTFDQLFVTDKNAQIGFQIDSIRPIHDDVVVVDGLSQMSLTDQKPRQSRFSAVLVRHENKWLMESVRETAATANPTIQDRLQQLNWLRGFWEDISDGITASIQCEWNEQGTYLIRHYLITEELEPPGSAARLAAGIPGLLPEKDVYGKTVQRLSTTEYIGWDNQQGQICSWLFRSDGQSAQFTWQRNGNNWLLKSMRRNNSDSPTQYVIQPAGEDGFTIERASGNHCDLVLEADFLRTARPIEDTLSAY